MAVNFTQNSVWTLKPTDIDAAKDNVAGLLIDGEEVAMAFQTTAEQMVFTNKRIIAFDEQGITAHRRSFSTLPYARIQYFSVQTPEVSDSLPDDGELFIVFSNIFTAKFEFKGSVDIKKIGRMISAYVLEK